MSMWMQMVIAVEVIVDEDVNRSPHCCRGNYRTIRPLYINPKLRLLNLRRELQNNQTPEHRCNCDSQNA